MRPNIVLIITDSQGHNVLGQSGQGFVSTPNIDRLAREGVQLDRAYNCAPVCTPARAGLFTGLHPHTAGAWGNDIPLGGNVRTMGSHLRQAGYETAYIGKWHLDGTDYFGTGIPAEGYDPDFWYDGRNYLEELKPEERGLWRSGLGSAQAIHERGVDREFTWAGRITNRAVDFISRQSKEKPFLLVVSYDEPHGPSTCPPPYCDRYTDRVFPLPVNYGDTLQDKPAHHRAWADHLRLSENVVKGGLSQPLYFGCGEFVDDEIGRVVDAIDQKAREDTVIIYTSDHGHYLGAHGLEGKGPALYEEVVRVPLIVRAPGIAAAGTRSQSLASHVDLIPTFLDLAGAEVPPILEGTSLVPMLRDPVVTVRDHVLVEFHRFSVTHDAWFGFFPIRSMVTQQHKLTVNLYTSDELYDLSSDPGEMRNLIDEPATRELRDGLHRRLLQMMDRIRDPYRGPQWTKRSWSEDGPVTWNGGERRPRPADGVLPPTYNYNTGAAAEWVPASPFRGSDR